MFLSKEISYATVKIVLTPVILFRLPEGAVGKPQASGLHECSTAAEGDTGLFAVAR